MNAYAEYSSHLDDLLQRVQWGNNPRTYGGELRHNLNGGAGDALRRLVPHAQAWESGAFFTPKDLARHALKQKFPGDQNARGTVLDPAFGAGDLLLRWAETLPVLDSLEATLANWGASLSGYELHPEFIAVAKRRLTLLAISRGASLAGKVPPQWTPLFPKLKRLDFTTHFEDISCIGTVVMNPPYTIIPAPEGCQWAKGGVNAAAVFVARILSQLKPGQKLIAILPEVLRSGTRYDKWRQLVAETLSISSCRSWGRFSKHADVDVFILEGIRRESQTANSTWSPVQAQNLRRVLGDYSKISVGAVVPHRHHEVGPSVPYITAKALPSWTTVSQLNQRRHFSGTIINSPFVAVRRTSSPHDSVRAIGTIICSSDPVAVENHLIVLAPISGKVKDCHRILKSLKNKSTTAWLNKHLRCRHLTVKILKQLPLYDELTAAGVELYGHCPLSALSVRINPKPGEHLSVQIGGVGRPVAGRVHDGGRGVALPTARRDPLKRGTRLAICVAAHDSRSIR